MNIHPTLSARVFNRQTNGTFENCSGVTFKVPRGLALSRDTIILNEDFTRIATDKEKREFRRLYEVEKKVLGILGPKKYEQVYISLEGQNCLMCQIILAHSPENPPRLDPIVVEAARRVWDQSKSESSQKVYFQYCSRSFQGVIPLRSLLDSDLIMYKDCYSVTTTQVGETRERILRELSPKGLVKILSKDEISSAT